MRSRFRSYIGIFTGRAADERIADLLNRGRIAVVLDGLDEIDGELRPAVVAALDEQATTFRLVVLSRSTEMAEVAGHRVLRGAAAVELGDVPTADVADYLRRVREDPRPSPGETCSTSCEPSPRAPWPEP